jgi:large subunit ribosomal protein L31e
LNADEEESEIEEDGELEIKEEDSVEDEVAEAPERDVEAEELFEEKDFVEEKPEPSTKEEVEEFIEERIYTIPLRRAWNSPPKKRAPKAMRIIKAFVKRHMKVSKPILEDEEGEEGGGRIIINEEVNEEVWKRGIEKPPRKLRIRAAKDEDGNVTIFLA